MSAVIKFAKDMKDMGSLSSLNMSSNRIGEVVVTNGWEHKDAKGGYKAYFKDGKGQRNPPPGCGAIGVIALARALQDMMSLSRLDLSGNSIGGKHGEPGVKAIAEALKVNGNITEINLASNKFDAKCAEILAPAIEAMGSLASLTISDNQIGRKQEAKIKQICAGKSIKCTF
jgi:hypothetical protein